MDKELFLQEYYYLEDKILKLEEILGTYDKDELWYRPRPNCSKELLQEQLLAMKKYMEILQKRAELEKIDLKILSYTWNNRQEFVLDESSVRKSSDGKIEYELLYNPDKNGKAEGIMYCQLGTYLRTHIGDIPEYSFGFADSIVTQVLEVLNKNEKSNAI